VSIPVKRKDIAMIFDTVDHIDNYKGLGRVYDALRFLAETDFSKLPLGKAELDGDNIYYNVQEYETSPERKIEAHLKYIDVQAVLEGEEIIGVAPIAVEKTLKEERPEKDCYIYECETQPIVVKAGSFLVLYPNDLHKPGVSVGAPAHCRKVVIKVKVD
jgi:YhcH/YjgK/YiaL family protein